MPNLQGLPSRPPSEAAKRKKLQHFLRCLGALNSRISDSDSVNTLCEDCVTDQRRRTRSPKRYLRWFQGNESWMLPIPATFVVGRHGKIVARFVDPDYRRRMAIDDLLAALRKEI